MPAPTITSRHNPLVARFKAAADHDPQWMLLDGAHLVAEALDAGLAVDCVAVDPDRLADGEFDALSAKAARRSAGRGQPLRARRDEPGSHTQRASSRWRRVRAMRPTVMHAGTALLVGAVDIQDPGNLGAVVRAAEAGGASGVVTTPGGADPFGWKAVRGSMGSVFRLPVVAGGLGGRDDRSRHAPRACRWWPLSDTDTRRCTKSTSPGRR